MSSHTLTNLLNLDQKGWEKLPQNLRSYLSNKTLTDLSTYPADWPELELLTVGASTIPVNDTGNYITISTGLDTFTSRGNVTINSTDTAVNPVVNPAWLSTTTDQQLAIQAFKRLRQIANATGITTTAFSPGPAVQTDSQIVKVSGSVFSPLHHAAATCELFPPSFPRSFDTDTPFSFLKVKWAFPATPSRSWTRTRRFSASRVCGSWILRRFPFCHRGIHRVLFVSFATIPCFSSNVLVVDERGLLLMDPGDRYAGGENRG